MLALAQGPGKKWEHLEVNKNGKTVVQPIHVRKGDTVQIIAGKDKGKIGEITQVRALAGLLANTKAVVM